MESVKLRDFDGPDMLLRWEGKETYTEHRYVKFLESENFETKEYWGGGGARNPP
jgi:hypothetical protein